MNKSFLATVIASTAFLLSSPSYACPGMEESHQCTHNEQAGAQPVLIDNGGMVVAESEAASLSDTSEPVIIDVIAYGTKFDQPYLFVNPGDSVSWIRMAGHTSTSVIIPEGATAWDSPMGDNITVQFDVPGIYVYVCLPHQSMGMTGTVVVGDITLEQIDAMLKGKKGIIKRTLKKMKKQFIKNSK